MTLDQLRIFIHAADHLNMTRAAEMLGRTQPAVSAAIAALEERYHTKLFDRVGRTLELTEAGRLFVPEARGILDRVASARRVLDELAGLERGEIRIAASQTLATYWLPRRLAHFSGVFPKIQLRMEVGNTARTASAVLERRADVGFVEGEICDALFRRHVVGGDRIALYARSSHLLTGRAITREEIASARWVMREVGSGTRDHLETSLSGSGISIEQLHIALEMPSNGAVLEALEGGELIGAVSELAAASRVRDGLIQPLRWPLPRRKFVMLMHADRSPTRAVSTFIASLGTIEPENV
ncbi:LysR substrate-binding domain-containing protein [Sphingobium sp. SA916]|uniref:LysR substrate-binding domain-containing protein n=1 Tax=Sphingobium sp. SA916 TaxID=1851207 RepID=UPI000C9ED860|nr:LysR substrate-binding domain-containing protein [Sphingobium sp. SA916]PNQ03960.1 LysR family transcriptional regulator [Sphingobium sp. SA916]